MSLSDAELGLVRAEARTEHDPFKIARKLGLRIADIRQALDYVEHDWKPVSDDGYGRPELRNFIVCRRHVHEQWPEVDEIRVAREQYDAGTHEVATGRDGQYLILYCIPRKKIDLERRVYFARDFGAEG